MGYSTNTVANLPIIRPKLPPTKKKKIKKRCTKECSILTMLLPASNTSEAMNSARTRALLFVGGKG